MRKRTGRMTRWMRQGKEEHEGRDLYSWWKKSVRPNVGSFVFCFPVCWSPPDVHSFLCRTTQTPTDKTMVCRPGDRLGSSFTCFIEGEHSPSSNCFCMSDDVTKIVRPISWFTWWHLNAKEHLVYQKSSLHFMNVSDDVRPRYNCRICDVYWTKSRD
jgi:hypothetical protein